MEAKPNYGAIVLKGSEDETKKDFTTVSVGKDITLEGWSGIFINHENKKAHGILVNMNGTINAVNDINGGTGVGIYINGNIQHENNAPVININEDAKINSTGNGIYSAGYAVYNINGAYISGVESGLGIKAGVFNINNATIIGTGEDKTPTSGNNNGINASGTSIQIESNPGYAGNIELLIKKGTFTSNNSNVIYEYTTNGQTKVKKIELQGGTYTSKSGKEALVFSDNFKTSHSNFITGGLYSTDPSNFLKSGYSASKNSDNYYEVTLNTINVFKENSNSNNKFPTLGIIMITLVVLIIIAYFNRKRLLEFIK